MCDMRFVCFNVIAGLTRNLLQRVGYAMCDMGQRHCERGEAIQSIGIADTPIANRRERIQRHCGLDPQSPAKSVALKF